MEAGESLEIKKGSESSLPFFYQFYCISPKVLHLDQALINSAF